MRASAPLPIGGRAGRRLRSVRASWSRKGSICRLWNAKPRFNRLQHTPRASREPTSVSSGPFSPQITVEVGLLTEANSSRLPWDASIRSTSDRRPRRTEAPQRACELVAERFHLPAVEREAQVQPLAAHAARLERADKRLERTVLTADHGGGGAVDGGDLQPAALGCEHPLHFRSEAAPDGGSAACVRAGRGKVPFAGCGTRSPGSTACSTRRAPRESRQASRADRSHRRSRWRWGC